MAAELIHTTRQKPIEEGRKEIKQSYGLLRAKRQQQTMNSGIKPADVEKAMYGTSENKRSISNVVNAVFSQ